MNGPLAQIVAVTCHANAILSGQEVEGFFPNNSTCMFCDGVAFVALKKSLLGKPKEKELAKTPDEWFNLLKISGAKGVRLLQSPQKEPNISDRMSAGFVGGGRIWSMEVLLPRDHSEYWVARWKVWNQNAPEQRIWRVTYARVSSESTAKINPPNLTHIESQLGECLRNIHSFSTKHECGGFTQCFADALDMLESEGKKGHGYHADLAPEGFLSEEAHTILDACQKAWVFGGMGSWNDIGFEGEDQDEYEMVSEPLFQIINEAISACANSSYYRLEQEM